MSHTFNLIFPKNEDKVLYETFCAIFSLSYVRYKYNKKDNYDYLYIYKGNSFYNRKFLKKYEDDKLKYWTLYVRKNHLSRNKVLRVLNTLEDNNIIEVINGFRVYQDKHTCYKSHITKIKLNNCLNYFLICCNCLHSAIVKMNFEITVYVNIYFICAIQKQTATCDHITSII